MTNSFGTGGVEWDEARSRVAAYLRAMAVAGPEQQARILQRVMAQAAARHAENPGASPTLLALNEIHDLSEQWFQRLLASPERVSATGLISLLAIDAPRRWPEVFLAEEIPADFQRALQAGEVYAAPDLKVASMVPQPFANPLREAMNLPSPLAGLARELAPLVTKVFALALSSLSLWFGHRPR